MKWIEHRTLWQSSGATRNSPWGQMNAWFCNASGQDEAGPLKNLLVGAHVTWESLCELTDRGRPANLHHSPCPEGGAGPLVLARAASRILAWPSAQLLRKAIGLSLPVLHPSDLPKKSELPQLWHKKRWPEYPDCNRVSDTEAKVSHMVFEWAVLYSNLAYSMFFHALPSWKKGQKAIVSQVRRGFLSHITNYHSPMPRCKCCLEWKWIMMQFMWLMTSINLDVSISFMAKGQKSMSFISTVKLAHAVVTWERTDLLQGMPAGPAHPALHQMHFCATLGTRRFIFV